MVSQERFSNLAVISIEKELLNRAHMEELSNEFDGMKVRRMAFKWSILFNSILEYKGMWKSTWEWNHNDNDCFEGLLFQKKN